MRVEWREGEEVDREREGRDWVEKCMTRNSCRYIYIEPGNQSDRQIKETDKRTDYTETDR